MIIKYLHSYWAFFTLLILLIAIINAFRGWLKGSPFKSIDLRISLFGLIFSHIQLLLGLILYFVSPYFSRWGSGVKEIMQNSTLRLYLIEHPFINIIAIVFITLGWSLHKKQKTDKKKFFRIMLFYFIGLILILSRIPWENWNF